MKRSIGVWQFAGFAAVSLGGTLLHFLYEWLGRAAWIAPFSGVNESTWEHMKLLFWPMLIYAIAESFFFRGRRDFWCVKARGMLLGLALIPVIFYTYNGVIGRSPDWLNIAIFFVSAACAYIYETKKFKESALVCRNPWLSVVLIVFIALCFAVFTFAAPEIGIFRDPITGKYGA